MKLIQCIEDILGEPVNTYFNSRWEVQDIHNSRRRDRETPIEKPAVLNEMVELAQKLCQKLPFIRVDFTIWNDRLYFGEFTFYDWAGFASFDPPEWNKILGDWLTLPEKKA